MKNNMNTNIKGKSYSALITAVLLFLFLDPYFTWTLQRTTNLYFFLELLLLLLFYLNSDIKSKGRGTLFAIFAILIILSALNSGLNVFGMMGIVCFMFVPFAKEQFARRTFDYFLTIYAVVVGISAIVWMFSLSGIVPSTGVIEPLNQLKSYNYTTYPLLVKYNYVLDQFRMERFCGPFDEPGVIGTICALLLTVGKFNFKDKRLLIVFVTGFLSMSFFYFIIVAAYYIIYTFTVSNNKKTGYFLIIMLTSLVVISMENTLLYETIWSRFTWNEETGFLSGDNRFTENSLDVLQSISGTSTLLWGTGVNKKLLEAMGGEASIFFAIVQYGLIFVLFYIYVFAAYGWKYKKNSITYFLYLLVFMASIYQRPFLFQPEFLFLFSLMAMSCGDLMVEKKHVSNALSMK